MTLSPGIKFAIIAYAFVVGMAVLAWTGIQADATAIGLNEHVYNIVSTVLGVLSAGATGLLGYLGLKAPTLDKEGK